MAAKTVGMRAGKMAWSKGRCSTEKKAVMTAELIVGQTAEQWAGETAASWAGSRVD